MSDEVVIKCSIERVPFKTSLNFEHLIDFIDVISLSKSHPMQGMAKDVMEKINEVPEIRGKNLHASVLKKNKALVNQLMSFVMNPFNDKVDIAATYQPFHNKPFHTTHRFDDFIGGDYRKAEFAKSIGNNKPIILVLYHAYLIVLEKIYDIKPNVEIPNTFKITDSLNKSVEYYNIKINTRYLEINTIGTHKKLTQDELKKLIDRDDDLDYWNEILPLSQFEFSGFMKFDFFNVTYDYLISQLKSDLLDKKTIHSQEGFTRIRNRVSALMQIPDIEFGLAAVHDFDSNINRNLIWKTIIPLSRLECDDYRGSIHEQAFRNKQIVLTDDFNEQPKTKVINAYLEKGIRNHAIVPLVYEDEVVGMLEFGAKEPGTISSLKIKRLYELFPIFTIALNRSKEEWNDKVGAIIQEEFTAIHPTVEWRFREAVGNLLSENPEKESFAIEPIIFQDVIPIYGASDIRGSSTERNKAIRSDLKEQLELALELILSISNQREVPLLNDLTYKIEKHINTVKSGLRAGDEISIIDFLKKEIDPVLLLIMERFPEMQEPVDHYFQTLDPELGVLYKERRNFEDSLTQINDHVGEIIDKEQVKAQRFFPHYFEKYRTDGLEYNAYIGQSLVKDLSYNEVYLKNIRLWQLLVKVKIARKIKELQSSLKTKLDITQLILVHSNPLSIAFRQDEKKFDVAGAYNIRYEITKKRIDKAMIKGTNERITQVGKIAIIYSYSDEIEEYRRYIDYMISQGYITDSVEYFDLEDLKGASGLKALRVEVNFKKPSSEVIELHEMEEVVNAH